MQGNISEPIIIEEDTGVGAGCVILMGVTIPKGAFIGSNSLVTKNDELEEYGIYGGNPLKLLKKELENRFPADFGDFRRKNQR